MPEPIVSCGSSYFRSPAEVVIVKYRASFTAYIENPDGGAWCVYVQCIHSHETRGGADKCAEKIARQIEKEWSLPSYAVEAKPGELRRLALTAQAARDRKEASS